MFIQKYDNKQWCKAKIKRTSAENRMKILEKKTLYIVGSKNLYYEMQFDEFET